MILFKTRLQFGRFVLGIVIGKEEPRGYERRKMRTQIEVSAKKQIKIELFREQNGCCNICKNPFRKDELTVDHIIPLRTVNDTSLDVRENLQLLCRTCHISKTKEDTVKHKWKNYPKRVVKFYI